MVYFDRCGSLLLKLEDVLGKPFVSSAPAPEAQLYNDVERIHVRCGHESFSLYQNWIETPVRVEQLAPLAWHEVSEHLEVAREIKRCGVRFDMVWPIESSKDGEARILNAHLFKESARWLDAFGEPTARQWITKSQDRERAIRVDIHTTEHTASGSLLPELKKLVPPQALVVSVDYTIPEEPPFSLHRGRLKDFFRASWNHARETAHTLSGHLGL
jgi:hypothetical protein